MMPEEKRRPADSVSRAELTRMDERLTTLEQARNQLMAAVFGGILIPRSGPARYCLAVIFAVIALLVRIAVLPATAGVPFVTFYPAVVIVAFLCGFGPGLLTAFLGLACGYWSFMPPFWSLKLAARDVPVLLVYTISAVLVCAVIRRLMRMAGTMSMVNRQLNATMGSLEQDIIERKRIEEALQTSEEQFRSFFEDAAIGMALVSVDGCWLQVNAALCDMLGYSEAEFLQRNFHDLTHPDDLKACVATVKGLLDGERKTHKAEKRYLHKNGTVVSVLVNVSLLRDESGAPIHFITQIQDITDRVKTEADLRIAAATFDARESIMITDASGMILRVNRAFTESTGYTAEEVLGRTPRILRSGRHTREFYAGMWGTLLRTGMWHGEIWDRRKNGEVYPNWLSITAVKEADGTLSHFVAIHTDMTEKKAVEERINALAFYDPLTDLPNRRLLMDRLQQALAVSARTGKAGALFFVDLDHFKTFNDSLGHDKGDKLLREIARRLSACVGAGDTVARFGGDEFVIVLEELGGAPAEAAAHAEKIGEQILSAVSQPYIDGGREYRKTASIGIALFSNQSRSVDDLMKQADIAMYEAKSGGRGTMRFFDPELQVTINDRALMEEDLRQGIAGGQLSLHYQPQVEGGRIIGAEVLIRWRHPQRGTISPTEFIPLAEETGLILSLGYWVLETACAQIAAWAKRAETAHLSLAVNVSARQIREPNFVDEVLAVIERTGADPRHLKLELTESMLVDDVEDIIAKMNILRSRGLRFSIDDFGTGYSSLYYLKRLPLTQLKIDRSFIKDVLSAPNDAAIARTIIALGQNLGLKVIAEGVETEAQRKFLMSHGCGAYQGYLCSPPVPVEAFEDLLREHACA